LTTSRTYATVDDLMNEVVNARIRIGFHYRNSVVVGEVLGKAAADWALARNFLSGEDRDNRGIRLAADGRYAGTWLHRVPLYLGLGGVAVARYCVLLRG
jgi:hypothetical protein